MAEKTYPMTLAEKEKLEKELEELKLVRRPEVVERIKIARSYGDLSENSEYEAAKDEQAFVEGQISSLETKIRCDMTWIISSINHVGTTSFIF